MFGELAIRGERNVVNFESLDEVSLFGDGVRNVNRGLF